MTNKYPLCSTPIAELIEGGLLAEALVQDDMRRAEIVAENAKYVAPIRKSYREKIYSDTVTEGIKSMADGKTYDSKSRYRQSLRDQGYEEVGTEKMPPPKKQSSDINWEQAISETLQGRR